MYIYILSSLKTQNTYYVGITTNPHRRIKQHNDGKTKSTAKNVPWEFAAITWVKDETKARDLEKYFKSGSGRAYWKKRLVGEELRRAGR